MHRFKLQKNKACPAKLNCVRPKSLTKAERSRGFIILFTVVLASIILSVALGVANIAYKEISFTTSARATSEAFFAADTGAECALYYDLVGAMGFNGLENPYGKNPSEFSTTCAGTAIDLNNGSSIPDPIGPWTFYLYPLGPSGTACAIVEVSREVNPPNPVVTTIISKGYNSGGDTSDNCTSLNLNRVEREIHLTY